MPQEEIAKARFDHVSDQGDLVFACKHKLFAVSLDNTLDHAILEAKQILEEEHGTPVPQASSALPISSIQAAVRAGESISQVAQEFSVNEALVRRFANPIETEKKYAIEQFLSMPAPKRGVAANNEEAIIKALEIAQVSMNTVSWTATRRNQSPWKIRASFQAEGQAVQADWAWNMRENTITCLNTPAQELIEGSCSFLPSFAAETESKQTEPTEQKPKIRRENVSVSPDFLKESAGSKSSEHHSNNRPTVELVTPTKVSPDKKQASSPSPTQTRRQTSNTSSAISEENKVQTKANQDSNLGYPVPLPVVSKTTNDKPTNIDKSNSEQTSKQAKVDNDSGQNKETGTTNSRNPLTAWMYGSKRSKNQNDDKASEQETGTDSSSTDKSSGSQGIVGTVEIESTSVVEQNIALEEVNEESKGSAHTSSFRSQTTVENDDTGEEPVQASKSNKKEETLTDEKTLKSEKDQTAPHKRSGRSAVPSWDEILFGE